MSKIRTIKKAVKLVRNVMIAKGAVGAVKKMKNGAGASVGYGGKFGTDMAEPQDGDEAEQAAKKAVNEKKLRRKKVRKVMNAVVMSKTAKHMIRKLI